MCNIVDVFYVIWSHILQPAWDVKYSQMLSFVIDKQTESPSKSSGEENVGPKATRQDTMFRDQEKNKVS